VTRAAVLLLALTVSGGATDAGAQVTTLRGLTFGTITSGTTTSVLKTSVSAAHWRISGTFLVLGGGDFQLTLPTTLTGPGPAFPITFSTTDGQRNTANNPNGGSSFDPHASQHITGALFSQNLWVWLGGSVTPPPGQTPGAYSATVVLTVTGML
jgi:hypothetical protein